MSCLDGSIVFIPEPFPENPERRQGSGPVGIWDLGQRRYECRVYDSFVEQEERYAGEGQNGHRREFHLGESVLMNRCRSALGEW